MGKYKKSMVLCLFITMLASLCACSEKSEGTEQTDDSVKEYIEETLNLANNENQEWTYSSDADAWILTVVSAVAYPELPEQQGVSVCIPGAYVTGIDTDSDEKVDVTAENASDAVKGSLVIDYEAKITSTNGQVYTAATAPVILNTGAAGYGSQNNSAASTSYAADGYINVSCGNRGKQDTATDDDGNTYYTGDAPSCLVDQKAAARYVKYNILLGNLPGSVDYFVSTGGSGGGAHAAMFAATSNNSDFYDYQIEAGAVGVYRKEDGSYSTAVTIDGKEYEISDGAWGCIAYSAITSLYEADMALAFEYYLNTEYSFKTSFQKQLAQYLSASYMEYINEKNLSVKESDVGFDLDGDGELNSDVALTIEYDPDNHAETNGYYGTYLDLYLAEFTQNLQWYLDNLDYSEDWTWFDEDGSTLSDDAVAAMTTEDKAKAFIEGRYTKSSSGNAGGMPGGDMGKMDKNKMADGEGREMPDGTPPDGDSNGEKPDGEPSNSDTPGTPPDREPSNSDAPGNPPDGGPSDSGAPGNPPDGGPSDGGVPGNPPDGETADGGAPGNPPNRETADGGPGQMEVETPDGGTTQSATGSSDSANYETYADMVAAYKEDIEEINKGDKYGKNIVSLYNPLNYIGADGTDNPAWTKIIMGASEGDISMFNSLNLQIAWLNAGVDAEIEWQWDAGHVPSEVLGDSFSLYVDQMYGEHVDGAESITKAEAAKQTKNGTSEEKSGTDISSWVSYDDTTAVSFFLADAAAYRTAGASKAMPAFDVIDYGQEDYVFGSSEKDARHWNTYLLEIFEEYADGLESLFSQTVGAPNVQPGGFGQGEVTQGSSANTIDTDGTYSDETYTSTGDDENALRITNATVVLNDCEINKDSGATSDTENGDFYGANAALLATDGANVTIKGATVNSSAQNGNGVFSYGEGTVVTISDSDIITTADNSGGIQTTGGATTNASNLQINTSGSSSAAIRSDRGGGTVNVDGGSYTSNGYNSPAVYSTANITVKNATLTANNSEALVIEGQNSIALENCTVSGNMSDTKGSSSDINVHNVMIYQSMSGDADVGTSVFSMTRGSLTSNNGDMIYVTNTHCILTLSDVEIVNHETDGYFLLVSGNDASHGWGNAGSNGAQAEFTADGQTFDGDIAVDSISSLTMSLTNGSVYTGAVNILKNEQNGSAVENNAIITIDSGSTWNLTGNCTVTSLTNNGTINFNGYTITLADGTVLDK